MWQNGMALYEHWRDLLAIWDTPNFGLIETVEMSNMVNRSKIQVPNCAFLNFTYQSEYLTIVQVPNA